MTRVCLTLLFIVVLGFMGCSNNKTAVQPTDTLSNKNMSTGAVQSPKL